MPPRAFAYTFASLLDSQTAPSVSAPGEQGLRDTRILLAPLLKYWTAGAEPCFSPPKGLFILAIG